MEWLGCLAVLVLLAPLGLLVWLLRLQTRLREQASAITDLQLSLARLEASLDGARRREAPGAAAPESGSGAETTELEVGPALPSASLEPVAPITPWRTRTRGEEAPSAVGETETGDAGAVSTTTTSQTASGSAAPPAAATDEPVRPQSPPASEAASAPPPLPPPASDEPPSPPPPPPPRRRIEWERWLGVRGAAVLGGSALALAALLFLRYSIEAGLIPPVVRVAFGYLAGVAALVASERLRRGRYLPAANGLAGAAVVILYGATWAARSLYDLLPFALAFALMALVTLVGGLLSWRHRTLVVASLGLVGGFATPLLLASDQPNPIGLFGYLLLLNLGVWLVARHHGWPWLALLAQAATFGYQLLWVGFQMEPGDSLLGLGILGLFALLFVVLGERGTGTERAGLLRLAYPVAGLIAPFVLAFYWAGRAELARDPLGLFVLLLLTSALAAWLALVHRQPLVALAAVAVDLALVVAWSATEPFDAERSWQLAGICVAMALVFHLQLEWRLRRGVSEAEETREPDGDAGSSEDGNGELRPALPPLEAVTAPFAAGSLGLWTDLVLMADDGALFLPWLLSVLALGILLLRQGTRVRWTLPVVLASTVVGGGLLVPMFRQAFTPGTLNPGTPSAELLHLLGVGLTAVLLAWLLGGRRRARRTRLAAGISLSSILLLLPILGDRGLEPLLFFPLTGLLALVLVFTVTIVGSGALYAVAAGLLWSNHLAWLGSRPLGAGTEPDGAVAAALLAFTISVLALTFWPLLTARRWRPPDADRGIAAAVGDRRDWRLAWITAALAGPFWFPLLQPLWLRQWGDDAIGLLPLLIAAVALLGAVATRRVEVHSGTHPSPAHPSSAHPGSLAVRRVSLLWFSAVALSAVAVAIPLQLDREWITVGWSLQAFAVLLLWRRLRHPGLVVFALLLHTAVTVRLLLNPAVLSYHPAGGLPVLNWLAYTYLVPAVSLVASAFLLARPVPAAAAAGDEESSTWTRLLRPAAAGCVAAAILLVFAWINLTILDAFSSGRQLTLDLERRPARDLTLSLAWTLYALALLALGMARRIAVLRWVSLAFLILTIAKVFLYDLGELTDLYRVASLAGLAVSLILVSLLYQRFVFGAGSGEAEDDPREESS